MNEDFNSLDASYRLSSVQLALGYLTANEDSVADCDMLLMLSDKIYTYIMKGNNNE